MKYETTKNWTTEELLKRFCEINNSRCDPIDLKNYEMMIKVRISDQTEKLSKRIYWLNFVIALATAVATVIAILTFHFIVK